MDRECCKAVLGLYRDIRCLMSSSKCAGWSQAKPGDGWGLTGVEGSWKYVIRKIWLKTDSGRAMLKFMILYQGILTTTNIN